MKQALLVIDVQEGFFANKANPVYNEEVLLENINQLMATFRQRGEPVILIRHSEAELPMDSPGWQVHSKLAVQPDDFYVNKTTPDSFLDTDLLTILNDHAVTSVTLAGLQTECCIDTTCRSAFGKKIMTVVVSDAHSTYDDVVMNAPDIINYHNRLMRLFATLKTTKEIVA
jgi:nicotinamidase-related amidase